MMTINNNNSDIDEWLNTDPVEVAFKTGNRILAERVDILQRAKGKLPSYYMCRANISKIALEQSTSEIVSSNRALSGGKLAIDLTMGLGVDSYYLSKIYKKVISIDIDDEKCRVARENFKLLNVKNIEVVCTSAEDFLKNFKGHSDLVFIDPSRRDGNGNRVNDLRSTKPNVLAMFPELKNITEEVCIKCSPMYDICELHRIFGNECSIEVISVDGECKETVVHWKKDNFNDLKVITILSGDGGVVYRGEFSFDDSEDDEPVIWEVLSSRMKYLASFDVSIVRTNSIGQYMNKYHKDVEYVHAGPFYVLMSEFVEDRNITLREIEYMEIYKPKKLRSQLTKQRFTILRKGFPLSMQRLVTELGIKEGGTDIIGFIQYNGQKIFLRLRKSI